MDRQIKYILIFIMKKVNYYKALKYTNMSTYKRFNENN